MKSNEEIAEATVNVITMVSIVESRNRMDQMNLGFNAVFDAIAVAGDEI